MSEAALELDIPESTLRLWIRQGKIPVLPPKRGERGVRLTAQTVEELRQASPLAWDGSELVGGEAPGNNSSNSGSHSNSSDNSTGSNSGSSTLPPRADPTDADALVELVRLRERLAGAQTACRVHAARRAEQERIVTFLKEQLARSQEAEREMRLLALRAMTLPPAPERQAIEGETPPRAEPVPRSRRWWSWWR